MGEMGALPTVIAVGAMKCGTSAIHAYLDAHPQIAMTPLKEVNYFFGPDEAPGSDPDRWWRQGQWHRGASWYASLFEASAPIRGESSPGYTSPSAPEAAARMAALVPGVRLVYLVRDPVARALAQWRHHVRDGTEARPLAEALLDESSQYVARGRYAERIAPFLRSFPREQLHVVVQERLDRQRRCELAALYAHVGADPGHWDAGLAERRHVGGRAVADDVPLSLRRAFWDRTRDDVDALRELLADELPEWRDPATPC
ncbi:sulfotransferase [Nocardioides sp. DS6]|uniref:Sulfotransferase n=1 Tax=Nocardioides eburneus TaxID=3231482 RepID=A0ABV3SWE8_9ACTN